jgi:uncharacterized protein YcfL
MKNLILIFLSLFILTGCATSSLKLNKDKELVLKYSSSDLLLTNKIKVKDSDELGKLKHDVIVLHSSSKALSNWNDKLVFFTPLISPLRAMSGS